MAPVDLSDRERAVLLQLAQGHTVKSAAAATGNTEYAAQELLRSARRKLGVGSSREAARLVAGELGSQKFGDTKDGMETGPKPRQSSGIIRYGGIMILALIAGIAAYSLAKADLPVATAQSSAPRVVSASPANGAAISEGRFVLSVTFDRPMQRGGMSFATGPEAAFPDCRGKPQQSSDGRTFRLDCAAVAGRKYVVWFNHGRYMNFRDAKTGTPAIPYRIAFSAKP